MLHVCSLYATFEDSRIHMYAVWTLRMRIAVSMLTYDVNTHSILRRVSLSLSLSPSLPPSLPFPPLSLSSLSPSLSLKMQWALVYERKQRS